MQARSILYTVLCLALATALAAAQTEQTLKRMAKGKVGVSADELVSFKSDVPYVDAIATLAELSKKLDGKILIDRTALKDKGKQIGINIESMYWKDALELILRSNQVWYNEYPEYREIVTFEEVGRQPQDQGMAPRTDAGKTAAARPVTQGATATPGASGTAVVDSSEIYAKLREITISSIFFEVNTTKLAENGMRFFLSRSQAGVNAVFEGSFKDAAEFSPMFNVSGQSTPGSLVVDVAAAVSMIENNQVGEVIARPQVTVRSGSISRIQVGQDFSTREKDFSGNIVEKFYQTGTILTVRPRVFKVGDLEFIDLQYTIERSTPQPSEVTVIVNKTIATGSLSLLNGEEGYVGGMYSNEVTTVRGGIPVLKDLPWWFFGLRYIFGYQSEKINRKELIVLLKSEMLPLVEERAARPLPKNVIQDKLREGKQDMERRTQMKKD